MADNFRKTVLLQCIYEWYCMCKTLMLEKSDEFDECMLNRQNFPTKILHSESLSIAYYMVIIY